MVHSLIFYLFVHDNQNIFNEMLHFLSPPQLPFVHSELGLVVVGGFSLKKKKKRIIMDIIQTNWCYMFRQVLNLSCSLLHS